jgi:hypothetical protein
MSFVKCRSMMTIFTRPFGLFGFWLRFNEMNNICEMLAQPHSIRLVNPTMLFLFQLVFAPSRKFYNCSSLIFWKEIEPKIDITLP